MADLKMAENERTEAATARFASPRIWILAALVPAVLLLGYWLFVRTTYEPVLTDLSPQDAADIVKVLDERKVPYRLADGGRTVLVPSDDADMARVELVGSELPMRGQVGFELFNQSDMGLTEFAQKINYQRALQGELARTILLLHGIDQVRVHLGLPERGVFRDEQARPKASVTLILKPGTALTESTVSGVQRMVAGAVPEMSVDGVSVLDGSGRVVSAEAAVVAMPGSTDAALESYRRQIEDAIGRTHPELRYELNLSLRPVAPAGPGSAVAARGNPDFAVNVRITTRRPLDQGLRNEVIASIEDAIDFERGRGDAILFLVGDAIPAELPLLDETSAVEAGRGDRVVAKATAPAPTGDEGDWTWWWPIGVSLAVAALLTAWLRDRRRTRRRDEQSAIAFADQLRERLRASQESAA